MTKSMGKSALLAVMALALVAPAGHAAEPVVDRPFDPTLDRNRVLYCITVHLSVAEIGAEILGLDEAAWQAADEAVFPRFQRLKPFAAAIERKEGKDEGNLYREAGGAGQAYLDLFRARAGGDRAALFAEALRNSEACDAQVKSWGAPPAG